VDLVQGEDVAANAPAAVDDFVDQDHGVGTGDFTEGLGVEVGDAVDEEFFCSAVSEPAGILRLANGICFVSQWMLVSGVCAVVKQVGDVHAFG
jgi:hypothetical protein